MPSSSSNWLKKGIGCHFSGVMRLKMSTGTAETYSSATTSHKVHAEGGCTLPLVARIARPTSLAIWHRRCSHRRPNRSGSPNCRHFASLDLKKHPDFSNRRPTSQDFRRHFFWHFSCDFRSSECVFTSLAKHLFRIASDLGMCDSRATLIRGRI